MRFRHPPHPLKRFTAFCLQFPPSRACRSLVCCTHGLPRQVFVVLACERDMLEVSIGKARPFLVRKGVLFKVPPGNTYA